MGKLYVFGIGGTGSRVMKALTMLLASGVECGCDTIVPIIIDPDASAADLTRNVEFLKRYNSIRSKLEFNSTTSNKFFATAIEESIEDFRMPLCNTSDQKFKDYMRVSDMGDENKAMMNMLFSNKNLESDMKVGFKGNPNIGSIVLNQFEESEEFKTFAGSITDNDKIFIVSSIFGGTGASGFPLLAKILRSNSIPQHNIINNVQIGAITVMPYFGVKPSADSEIDSGTFVSKTKAALNYYKKNISDNNTIDTLYYVADTVRDSYENNEGGSEQKNNAHYIELVSALAILDFSKSDYKGKTQHKEYALEKDSNELIFSDLGVGTKNMLMVPLTKFTLFGNYFRHESQASYLGQTWAKDGKFDKPFMSSQFMTDVFSFQKSYFEWLREMSENNRKFVPFELNNIEKAFDIVKGENTKSMMSLKSNYALYDDFLNKYNGKASSKEKLIIDLFYDSTSRLVEKKFNF